MNFILLVVLSNLFIPIGFCSRLSSLNIQRLSSISPYYNITTECQSSLDFIKEYLIGFNIQSLHIDELPLKKVMGRKINTFGD